MDASQDLREVRLETDEVLQICGYYTLQQCCCLLSRQQAVQSTSCTHTTLFPNKFTHDLHFILKKDYKACGNNDNFFRTHHHVRMHSPKHFESHTPLLTDHETCTCSGRYVVEKSQFC